MSNCQLDGIRAKVARAQTTLADLEARIVHHCETQKRCLETQVWHQDTWGWGSDEPDTIYDYAVAVGEVGYNLRSGLDHLVWQLVLANGQTPGTWTEFPTFWEESSYRKAAERKLRGLTHGQLQTVAGLQPFRDVNGIGPHLRMLHAICNIDKHRHLNVVSTHSILAAYMEGEIPQGLVPRGMTGGLGLVDLLRGTGYEHMVKVDVVVDVCFRDPELEQANPGYGSLIETAGTINRPPVMPALKSCLGAVGDVVRRLTGESVEGSVAQQQRHNFG